QNFLGADVELYRKQLDGKIITGVTTGIKAKVLYSISSTSSERGYITLYVKYIDSADSTSETETKTFKDNEQLFSDGDITFGTTLIEEGSPFAQMLPSAATAIASSAYINEGVYFIRGHFVRVAEQRIILDKYTNTPSYRVGLNVTETLETPEEDSSLLDNAAGSTNLNAKGAHRLKLDLTLAKLSLTSEEDDDFIELLRTDQGVLQEKARNTEYSVLGETLARRTYDESGDYTVRAFQLDVRETSNDGLNNGVYDPGTITDSQNAASDNHLTIQVAPGKAYVRGYEIETIAPKYIDILKPRTFENFNAAVTPVEVGNFIRVTNTYGSPEISPFISGSINEPYRQVGLYDTQTNTPGSSQGTQIGVARARGYEHHSGSSAADGAFGSTAQFNLYLFDIRMFTKLTMNDTPSVIPAAGEKITGQSSGAYGYVVSQEVDGSTSITTGTTITLASVVGTFSAGENVTSSGSTETDEILENSSNADLTISSIENFDFSAV
ncbi:MAG: DUF4815 domain-containing protein, partial [Candidatus Poseidoniales archaeon]